MKIISLSTPESHIIRNTLEKGRNTLYWPHFAHNVHIIYFIYVSSRSWLYLFCARCHGRDDTPSWEPPGWRRACPQPFCPTYRKFARVLCLFLLGLLLWGVVYSIIGNDAAPGGQLFGLAALSIAAYFGGWLISLTTLPALIGMLITGMILQNIGLVQIEGQYTVVIANLRWVTFSGISKEHFIL